MPSEYPMSEDVNGKLMPGLSEPRHQSQSWQPGAADEVIGDAAANGTAVLSITIADGETLILFGVNLASKVAAATFLGVISTTAAVGGVETLHQVWDIPAAGTLIYHSENPIVTYHNNTGATRYFNIYLPQTRAGAATNNAVTQYVSASIAAVLD